MAELKTEPVRKQISKQKQKQKMISENHVIWKKPSSFKNLPIFGLNVFLA